MKGKEFEVELDETPYRHDDEDYDTYKERQKMVRHFKKMKKQEMFHESLSNIDKMIGRKGITYIKNEEQND